MAKSGALVVAFANTKGGVGKTTLATSLGVYLAATKKRVGLVSLDPQSDLVDWLDTRARKKHEPVLERYVGLDELDEIMDRIEAAGLDVLIIDCPPHFLKTVQQALGFADIVVIPLKGGGFDLSSHEAIMAAVVIDGLPHLVVINESPPAWKITKAARKALEAKGHTLAETEIQTRADYRSASFAGLTAAEIERGDDAATEIAALWGEILAIVKAARKRTPVREARS